MIPMNAACPLARRASGQPDAANDLPARLMKLGRRSRPMKSPSDEHQGKVGVWTCTVRVDACKTPRAGVLYAFLSRVDGTLLMCMPNIEIHGANVRPGSMSSQADGECRDVFSLVRVPPGLSCFKDLQLLHSRQCLRFRSRPSKPVGCHQHDWEGRQWPEAAGPLHL
jgi:hypothetical protein